MYKSGPETHTHAQVGRKKKSNCVLDSEPRSMEVKISEANWHWKISGRLKDTVTLNALHFEKIKLSTKTHFEELNAALEKLYFQINLLWFIFLK